MKSWLQYTWCALPLYTCCALLLLQLAPLSAQASETEDTVNTLWKDAIRDAQLSAGPETLELSLEDAITVSLRRNLGLQVQRMQRGRALLSIMDATGIYDLNLSATGFMSDETQASASNLDGADVSQSERAALNLGLSQLITTGGTVELDWQNSRFESNSFFSSVNPSFNINWDLVYTQPLLRNFGRLVTERGILVARNNSQSALHDLHQAVINTIVQVETAYWQLVESREQRSVAEESLRLAEELHEMNRIQVEVGTLAPLELVQSEAGIATRREEIIRTEAAVEDAADDLRRLLNLERGSLVGRRHRTDHQPRDTTHRSRPARVHPHRVR